MDTFTLYVALRTDVPLDDAALAGVADGVGAGRAWVDGADGALFRVSVDTEAESLDAALEKAHVLAGQARALSPSEARVVEVSAMTDEDVAVWRAEA